MDFSKLRHRITFQKPDGVTKNTLGEDVPTYGNFSTVWANVAPMRGREYHEAQKIRAETTYKVTVRYLEGISTDMQIMYAGRVLEIISILNIDERNVELQIVASEVDNNGKNS